MITHGIRIEFYDPAIRGAQHRPLLGALQLPGGYTALAVPAKGSKIAVASLRTAPTRAWKPLLAGQHLLVHDILHAPVPTRNGQTPLWWGTANVEPSITVVVRAELHGGVASLVPPLRQFADDGWQLQDQDTGSNLAQAWMIVTRHRQLHATAAKDAA